jgi:hypothetical protein
MNARSRWILLPLLALTAFAALAPAAGAAPGKAAGAGSLLYVQQMEGGTLRHVKAGLELELTGVSPRVSTFTDRPRRRAGSQPLRTFIGGWANAGFAADPPNAALVLNHAPSSRDVAMLTLSRPRYDRRDQTLTFRVKPLREKDPTLAGFAKRADPLQTGDFGSASLFVDNGATYGGEASVTINVVDATPGAPFRLSVRGGSFAVPTPNRGYGLAIQSQQPMPITTLLEAANAFTMYTTAEAPSMSFTLVGTILLEGANPQLVVESGPVATITASWPTLSGQQTELMTLEMPLTLTGLVGS